MRKWRNLGVNSYVPYIVAGVSEAAGQDGVGSEARSCVPNSSYTRGEDVGLYSPWRAP